MSVPTLRELIEEVDVRQTAARVIIGGATLPKWTSISYDFQMGQVPVATIIVPGREYLPAAVAEEASVEIWFGFRSGMAVLDQLVFGGAVVDSVGFDASNVIIECVMDGPRKLTYGYNRRINYTFESIEATTAVLDLLALAGVSNYAINLDPWVLGTAVPQVIQFSSYGEAINKISEVDGSPWYAMPTGQVRIENRDPIPSPSARRTYFSGVLTGAVETQPVGIANASARPRINDIQLRKFRSEVGNFIEVDGAVLTSLGPNGEQNSEQIVETVDGASGQFPNGAYWIPTPPLFQDFTFSNELIDTNAKAFAVAERYFFLKNRLFEKIPLSIPGDPDVFLGETVEVVDPNYSGVRSLYFVEGYHTSIDSGGCTTDLQLTGGPEAGTTGYASPFAEFYWKYTQLHDLTPGGFDNGSGLNLGPNADQAAKLCEDLPADTGSPEQGGGFTEGEDKRTVLIGLDGTASQDFDGRIVLYEWEWTDDSLVVHNFTGPRWTLVIDPDVLSSIEVTLTVTDDSGRTDSITKNIYTSADWLDPGFSEDPTQNDTENGGGVAAGECTTGGPPEVPGGPDCPDGEDCVEHPPPGPGPGRDDNPGQCNGVGLGYFVAAGSYAMGSRGNGVWTDLDQASAGVVGEFISVAAGVNYKTQKSYAIFGTTLGEIVISNDFCATGSKVFTVPGNPRIEKIAFDSIKMGTPAQGEEYTNENDQSGLVSYPQDIPGVLTIRQAYEQCLAVGFGATPAVVAVAILIAESGLNSAAVNVNPGPPISTDRGIAQINNVYHPEVTDACAYSTACAIRAMFTISSGGTDFTPWSSFNAGTHRKYLSQIQEELGVEGQIGDDEVGASPEVPRAFRVYASTSDGRIFFSDNSGRDWTIFHDFLDGFPIYDIQTPDLQLGDGLRVWVFGGDVSRPESLLRILSDDGTTFVSNLFVGTLGKLIAGASDQSIRVAAINDTAILIGFSGDISAWVSNDPIGDPESWFPAVGLTGAITAAAPGYDGEFLVATTDGVFRSVDNENFSLNDSTLVNGFAWQGLPGVYLAAVDPGLEKTIDYGDGFGFLRPNTEFAVTWPPGAVGYQVAFTVGPSECPDTCAGISSIGYDPAVGYIDGISEYTDDISVISATAPSLLLLKVHNSLASGVPLVPSASLTFIIATDLFTFTQIETVLFNDDHDRLTLFAGQLTQDMIDDGDGTLSVDCVPAQDFLYAACDIVYGGTIDAISHVVSGAFPAATEIVIPLERIPDRYNYLYSAIAIASNPAFPFLSSDDLGQLAFDQGTNGEATTSGQVLNQGNPEEITWNMDDATPAAAIALELIACPVEPTPPAPTIPYVLPWTVGAEGDTSVDSYIDTTEYIHHLHIHPDYLYIFGVRWESIYYVDPNDPLHPDEQPNTTFSIESGSVTIINLGAQFLHEQLVKGHGELTGGVNDPYRYGVQYYAAYGDGVLKGYDNGFTEFNVTQRFFGCKVGGNVDFGNPIQGFSVAMDYCEGTIYNPSDDDAFISLEVTDDPDTVIAGMMLVYSDSHTGEYSIIQGTESSPTNFSAVGNASPITFTVTDGIAPVDLTGCIVLVRKT